MRVDPAKSLAMSNIPTSGSRIEVTLGRAMWAAGIRYRRQYRKLPGKPDFVVVWARIAIFCDSSFWHGRDWPASADAFRTNRDFWIPKIARNIRRDLEVNALLNDCGWSVFRFWDDEILTKTGRCVSKVVRAVARARKC